MKPVFILLLGFTIQFGLAIQVQAENVDDSEVLLRLHEGSLAETLPAQFNLVSWNIEKAKQKEKWRQDFMVLAKRAHLMLLQEGMADNYLPEVLKKSPLAEWWMAQSWRNDKGHSTGVITGSTSPSLAQYFLRSPNSEPIANTPKMTLLQTFALADGAKLLLLNVHGINFVTNPAFKKQMQKILEAIDESLSTGAATKVVFAGDFNTWNESRLEFIGEELARRGFAHVMFQQDRRNLKLDHVFVLGCSIETAVLYSNINSSDHAPIEVGLDCAKSTGIGPLVDSSHYSDD